MCMIRINVFDMEGIGLEKLVNFAHDMTTFVRDKQSYLTLFKVNKNLFGTHTGLKINRDKTESLLLGNLKESRTRCL